ncbi:hypothetical protein K503DRAFT_865061 [Rhizopogon vinicolor AM-OR11-026]|uniref:Uncharacterized protein n=1 Tax=Rhizopogon vinicolor AM-OR11-026 TaxID=1314800 RepID=A0A1B7N4S4_9AGAM|nr:hypothetical protein K503DRAFT_865061 [Rhizopogon vinicolor AM-OR11-026]
MNSTNPVKLPITAIAYKPFLSLFNMTGVAAANPSLAGIVDYAAALAFELRQPSAGGEPVIRFNFKNGSDATFVSSTTQKSRVALIVPPSAGAVQLLLLRQNKEKLVEAGFLGAGLTLAVVAFMVGTLAFLGMLTVGKFRKRQPRAAGVFELKGS